MASHTESWIQGYQDSYSGCEYKNEGWIATEYRMGWEFAKRQLAQRKADEYRRNMGYVAAALSRSQ